MLTPRLPRFRFTLRALLLAIVPLAIWLASVSQAARTQREVIARIEAKGGWVFYRHQKREHAWGVEWLDEPPPVPQWLRSWIGDDYFQTVIDVQLLNDRFQDEDLEEISKLKSLESVTINYDTPVSKAALQRLKAALPNCRVPR